ncbi:MAG: hypothetical protein SFV20_11270 [Sphingopyxis sp.]|nr:hypothetical protein [Sphingopyxis sp.]
MTDRYTKCVLTIIAIFLGVIAIENVVSAPAIAQNGAPVRVQICDSKGDCAFISNSRLWVTE